MLSMCRWKWLNARIGPSSFMYTMVFYRKNLGFVRPLFGLFVERCVRRNCRKDSNHRKVGSRRRRISWPSTRGSSLVEHSTIWSNNSRKDSETVCSYMHKVHMTGLSRSVFRRINSVYMVMNLSSNSFLLHVLLNICIQEKI